MVSETEQTEDITEVYTGLEIPLSRSYPISSSLPTKLILVLGPVGAGKTTLISRIFDQFHDGPIGHWKFAGSETIVGYENILRSYRSENVNSTPAVERTSSKLDPDLFHINLKKNNEEVKAALIANLSGELFNSLIQESNTIEDMVYFKRAGHISIMLDGGKLINKAGRASELRNAYLFLERLVSAKHISDNAIISVLIAKEDVFRAVEKTNAGFVDETIKKIKDDIISPLKKMGVSVLDNPIKVVSQPLERRLGFNEVLDAWLSDIAAESLPQKKVIKSKRVIDHFKAGKK